MSVKLEGKYLVLSAVLTGVLSGCGPQTEQQKQEEQKRQQQWQQEQDKTTKIQAPVRESIDKFGYTNSDTVSGVREQEAIIGELIEIKGQNAQIIDLLTKQNQLLEQQNKGKGIVTPLNTRDAVRK